MQTQEIFDVVVVGAGPAGSATAYQMARCGYRVAVIEIKPEAQVPHYIVAVPPWMFDRADIPRPLAPELDADRISAVMVRKGRPGKLSLPLVPAMNLDFGRLTERLRRLAVGAGATFFYRTQPRQVEFEGTRPVGLLVQSETEQSNITTEFRARLFVEASGKAQAVLRRVPELARHCPAVAASDFCDALMEVRSLRNPELARESLSLYGAMPDDFVNLVGSEGGFSIIAFQANFAKGEVALLTGSIAGGKARDAAKLSQDFRFDEPWVGDQVRFGARGLIPLRRSYDRLAAPGLVLIGSAGCMSFPAHASGVGNALVASRILAEKLRNFDDPGSLEATWAYQAAFQREIGAVNAAYEVFRKKVQAMDGETVGRLLASGFMTEKTAAASLEQKALRLSAREMLGMSLTALRSPRLSVRFAPSVMGMQAAEMLYRRYPQKPDLKALRRWSWAAGRLFGEEGEVK